MLLRLRFLIYAVLLCVLMLARGRSAASACGTINACATVIEPMGLLPVGDLPRSLSVLPLTGSFDYLLVSPTRGFTLSLDGLPIDLNHRLTTVSELLSGLYLKTPPSEAPLGRTIVLTLIYSEN